MGKYLDEDLSFFTKTEKAIRVDSTNGKGIDTNYKNIVNLNDRNVKENITLDTVSAIELQKLELSPIIFVAEGMLPQGLNIIASPPKYGKSWLVLDLCLSVASGKRFLGHNTLQGGCLYLALEDSLHRLQDRMNKVLGGCAAPVGFDYAIQCNDLANGLIEQLDGYITSKPETKLIAIDTFQKIRCKVVRNEGAYSVDYQEMGKLKEFADKHKICMLLVHHLRKMADDTDVFNRISGTNGISGAADTMLVLSKCKRSDNETTLSIVGRDVDSSETILEFDKESYKWKVIGSAEERAEELAHQEYERDPVVITIKRLLVKQPCGWSGTAGELFEACIEEAKQYPAETPAALGKKLKSIAPVLFRKDGILYKAPPVNGSHGKRKHTFTRQEGIISFPSY